MLSTSIRDASCPLNIYPPPGPLRDSYDNILHRDRRVYLPLPPHHHVRIRSLKGSRILYNDVSDGDDLHAYEQRAEVPGEGAYTVLWTSDGEVCCSYDAVGSECALQTFPRNTGTPRPTSTHTHTHIPPIPHTHYSALFLYLIFSAPSTSAYFRIPFRQPHLIAYNPCFFFPFFPNIFSLFF